MPQPTSINFPAPFDQLVREIISAIRTTVGQGMTTIPPDTGAITIHVKSIDDDFSKWCGCISKDVGVYADYSRLEHTFPIRPNGSIIGIDHGGNPIDCKAKTDLLIANCLHNYDLYTVYRSGPVSSPRDLYARNSLTMTKDPEHTDEMHGFSNNRGAICFWIGCDEVATIGVIAIAVYVPVNAGHQNEQCALAAAPVIRQFFTSNNKTFCICGPT